MAYDAARDEVVTFGGCCFHDETWLWGDGEWRVAEPPLAPSGRAGNVMAYDPIRRETVMIGGSQYGETWTWDGQAWDVHHPIPSPSFRNDAAIAFMPRIGKIVLFGGYPDLDQNELGTQLGDTWTWDGSAWTKLEPVTSPPDRYAAGLALDPASGDLILFGGMDDDYASVSDTWRFDGTTWHRVETLTTPPARSYFQMAGNPAIGGVEMFSGYYREGGFAPRTDRWFFVDGDWTQEPGDIALGAPPPYRHGGRLVYDSADDAMVLYGGSCDPTCGGVWTERLVQTEEGPRLEWEQTPSPWPADRMSAGTMVEDPLGRGTLMHGGFADSTGIGDSADTWLWDGAWKELTTEGRPPGRQGLSLAVHRDTKTVVLFGGLTGPLRPPDDTTWVLDGARWAAAQPAMSPPGRYHAGMAEDRNGNVVLFGGFAQGGAKRGDTWGWDGTTWTAHTGPGPSARSYPQMAYDPVRKETVLFGGSDSAGATLRETWVWDGEAWHQRSPIVSPPGRLGSSFAWDPASRRLVLFGGATCANLACVIFNDVWAWDGSTWERLEAPRGGPSARWFSLAGPTTGGIVMFGGHGGGTGLAMADTWLWRAGD